MILNASASAGEQALARNQNPTNKSHPLRAGRRIVRLRSISIISSSVTWKYRSFCQNGWTHPQSSVYMLYVCDSPCPIAINSRTWKGGPFTRQYITILVPSAVKLARLHSIFAPYNPLRTKYLFVERSPLGPGYDDVEWLLHTRYIALSFNPIWCSG